MRVKALLFSLACTACVAQPLPPPAVVAVPSPAAAPRCREFDTVVTIAGRPQQAFGTACLQPDGSWKVVQSMPGQSQRSYVVLPQTYRPYYPAYTVDPWVVGPPLFLGGAFIGLGWGHGGWRGGWHDGWHDGWHHRRW